MYILFAQKNGASTVLAAPAQNNAAANAVNKQNKAPSSERALFCLLFRLFGFLRQLIAYNAECIRSQGAANYANYCNDNI